MTAATPPEQAPEPGRERELLPIATGARTWEAVRDLLRPQRMLVIGAFSALIAATGMSLLTAPLLGHIVDLV
ncbi:MAG TPA: hypothetical protein VHH34_19970, partial [Pseudonocardiaceae bacterium]|nr:hypothetical protein [Pseudonocardiaceae bacterium]